METKGTAWIALWRDGKPGWAMPKHIGHHWAGKPEVSYLPDGEPLYLCDVTLKVRKNRNGRPIIRRHKAKKDA